MSKCITKFIYKFLSPKSKIFGIHKLTIKENTFAFFRFYFTMDNPREIFNGSIDRFNGITIDSSALENSTKNFEDKLQKSMAIWKDNNTRNVWFKVYLANADWVPQLVQNGFKFHHAKRDFVMMYKWLPVNESENIPDYAHTLIGVGNIIIDDENRILVVSDKNPMISNSWKLPGGYVEPRENIINAGIREVKEETGIDSEFLSVVSLRHSHGGNFGCSDIYIVLALNPKHKVIKRCEREIAKCEWMPIKEYLNNPNVHETNRHFVKTYLFYRENGIKFDCETKEHQILKKLYSLYYVKQ